MDATASTPHSIDQLVHAGAAAQQKIRHRIERRNGCWEQNRLDGFTACLSTGVTNSSFLLPLIQHTIASCKLALLITSWNMVPGWPYQLTYELTNLLFVASIDAALTVSNRMPDSQPPCLNVRISVDKDRERQKIVFSMATKTVTKIKKKILIILKRPSIG